MHYCTRNPSKLPHICIVWSPQMGNLMTPAKTCHQTSWWLNPAMWKILKHSQIGSWNPKVWGEHNNYVWNLHPAHHSCVILQPSFKIHVHPLSPKQQVLIFRRPPMRPARNGSPYPQMQWKAMNLFCSTRVVCIYLYKYWYNIDQRRIAREKQTPTKRTSRTPRKLLQKHLANITAKDKSRSKSMSFPYLHLEDLCDWGGVASTASDMSLTRLATSWRHSGCKRSP